MGWVAFYMHILLNSEALKRVEPGNINLTQPIYCIKITIKIDVLLVPSPSRWCVHGDCI
jgi:hypothetical protein